MFAGSDTRSRENSTASATAASGSNATCAARTSEAITRTEVIDGFFSGFSVVR